jgi:hypothetical protein
MLLLLHRIGRFLLRLPAVVVWGAAVGWMAFIWRLSGHSMPTGPPTLAWSWFTNFGHAPIFGFLGLLLAAGVLRLRREQPWPRVDRGTVAVVLSLVALYGLVDEWHQSWVPRRDAAWGDLLTDVTGAACVLWIIAYLGREGTSERGLWKRLAVGLLLCATAAGISTLS